MCKRVIFVVDNLFLQDENKSEERFLKKLAGGVALMFLPQIARPKKEKGFVEHRCCSVTMQNFFYAIRQRSI